MIIRIVKLTIDPLKVNEFLELFNEVREEVSRFSGCLELFLYTDIEKTNVYFTYSVWKSTENLDSYRFSNFFKTTWPKIKKCFESPAEAWSLTKVC